MPRVTELGVLSQFKKECRAEDVHTSPGVSWSWPSPNPSHLPTSSDQEPDPSNSLCWEREHLRT